MSIVKRFNRLLGLEKIDVLVDEKDTSRHIIISDMPESLPQGKSSFLIEVSPYMRKGIELQIDFIDSKGNSIYVEPVSNYLEGTSRTVSVEVYNTVAPGVATMIIVGELESIPLNAGNFSETEIVPDEFKGVYNVRLTKEVIINTAEINTQPIKFYSSPRLTAVEKRFGSMEREVVGGETTSSAFSIIGAPTQQEPFSIYTPNETETDALGAGVTEIDEVPKPPDGNIKGDEADIERLKRFSKKRTVRTDSKFKRSKRIRRRRSPEEYPYRFTIQDSNHEFTTEEIGGEIKFSNIVDIYNDTDPASGNTILDFAKLQPPVSFNVVSDTNDENFPTHYTASIAKLENNKTAYVNTPFTKQDENGNYRLLPMQATGKVHYTKQPSASYSITNIVSYADVTLSHLRTFSGEVFKAKVYVRAEGSFDDYKLLAEVPVESPELMVNGNSVGIGERTGYFISDLDLNTYWEKFGGTNGLSTATSTTTASFDNSVMLDSVMVSGSISSFTDQIRFQQKDVYKFNLTKGIDYDLSFNAVGEKGTDGRALLMVYVSGSSVKQQLDLHFDDTEKKDVDEPSQYGKRMGVLEVETGDAVKKEFGLVRHNFNPNSTGDAKVQFRVISGKWNISDISVVPATDTGFSPSFVRFQQELPPELTHKRPETLEFLTEFYDINNNLADEIAVTTGSTFTGGNMVITGDDNVLEHNLFIGGDTTGSGIHMGGTSSTLPEDGYSEGATGSGFIRSIGYLGFESASNSALGGKKGFMIYSGSVLPNSGEDYKGVGLELVGASGSLKFRTSPSVFDVQADSFFVGKTNTQFISGSGEKIEISSSNFHLSASGDVNMTGTITADAGNIGGFTIEDGRLTAGAGNSAVTMSGNDQLFRFGSGSAFDINSIDGILFGKDTDGQYKFGVGKGNSYILFDGTSVNIRSEDINVTASVFSVDVDVFKLSANNLFVSSSQGGFISAGNPRPTGITGTNKGIFIAGRDPSDTKPKFLAGDAAGARLSFDGDNIFMSSSGFFLGGPSQFVSGSEGNIEISSSNFHLDNSGNVIMSGKVTANEGSIGGFNITNDALSSANFLISGSSTGNNFFISSSNFNVKASGDVTASALDLTGGSVGGLTVTEGQIAVGSILKLKDSGQITGSSVLFSGGTIGGFTLSSGGLTDSADSIQLSSTQASMSLGTGQEILMRGNSNSPFISIQPAVALVDKAYGEAGIFMGVPAGNPPLFSVVGGANSHIKFNGSVLDIKSEKAIISGSDVTLETPRFFLGKVSTTFVSGSNGNIEISSSQFHLTRQGNVTGSAILLGNKSAGQFLQFVNNTLTVQGAITADSIAVPSAAPTPSSSITSTGLLTTVSASIGGFDITSAEIKDKDGNLRLKSNGQITASKALFTAGKIAAWNLSGNNITSTGGGIRLNGNGNSAEISVNSHTFASEGIQFGFNSGNPRFYAGDGAQNFLRYDSSNGVNIQTTRANISGSEITLETPKFFLGKKSNQFVSGSNGNIEISSSNFHLTSQGNVTMSGEITAAGGTIGGFTIGDELTSTAGTLILRGASGRITASNAKITGDISANTITANTAGTIANFNINSTEIASSNNNLRLKASGQITASDAKITGDITANTITANTAGTIGNFNVNSVGIKSSNSNLVLSASGQITASDALLDGTINVTGTGTIAGWTLASDRFNSLDDNFRITSTGAITIKNHSFGQSGFQIIENGGTTQFYVGNGSTKFIKFDGSNVDIGTERLTASGSSINLGAPSFRLGSATNFISGSGGTLVIQNTGTTTISGSQVTIETPKFFLGKRGSQFVSGSNSLIEISSSKFHLKNDGDVIMNNITASNANISGKMTATSGEIGGFTIGDDLSNSAGSTLKLKGSSGQITASAAQITGDITANTITANTAGTIANFQINSTEIKSANQNLRLKANGQITASAAQITGKITATSGQIAGFSIDGNTLTATNFTLDASGKRITLGTGNNIFIADGDEGIQLGHATFGSAPFSVTRDGVLKAVSGTVGGFTLSSTQITSNNLVLNSSGVIQTSNFASGQTGWRISSAGNGEAEFQNVKIRGTLSTAVFEKESVNAVGGQLYIANSTALTGSVAISASAATMSVANVGGFVANEILSAKKISGTGFNTEYMLVQSASRDFPTSENDFRGKLFVVRGYRSGSAGASGSLGDSAGISQSLDPGQVIVSTGKVGTGFIRLNANPNDVTTPYMDIVERTGSGVYDVSLKARLGDLSGLSSGLLYGNASPGFGLFTENVFLQGAITATTGSFTGKVHVGTTDGIIIDGNAKKLYQGTGTHNNQNTGFYMDSTGKFSLGDKLVWDSSTETLTITGTINITDGSGFATAASVSGSFPSATSVSASLNASSSALTTNLNASSSALNTNLNASSSALQGNINQVSTSVSASLNASSSALQSNINTVQSNLNTVSSSTAANIMTDANGKIIKTPSTSGLSGLILKSTHLGFASSGTFKAFIGSTGNFLFKNDDDNLISFGQSTSVGDGTTTSNLVIKAANAYLSGSSINLLTSRFFFGDNSNFISGSGGNLKIFSTGETTLSGSSVTLETPKFFLGKKGSQFLSGSNNQIEISSSKFHLNNDGNVIMNQITASGANVSGKITADSIVANTTGSIAGFTINSEEIRSSNSQLRLKSSGEITASNYLFNGNGVITGSVTIGTSATILGSLSAGSIATPASGPPFKSEINSQGFARFTSASIAGWDIDSTSIASVDDKVIIDSSNKRITINNTSFGSEGIQLDYNSGTPRFFAGSATKFVKFDGSNVDIVTEKLTASGSSINLGAPSFRLGGASNFISGSGGDLVIQTSGTTTISGSAVDIQTPKFFLGKVGTQFISGSNNNIEITSSMFHLDPKNSKVAISGSITATTGKIGGMLLENNKLKSQYGDGEVITKIVTVEGSTKYYIDGVQQPTLELKVGNTYRFDNSHSSNGGHPFRFATSADGTTYSTGVTVVGSEGSGGTAYVQIVVTASTPSTLYYKCNSHGSMGGQLNIITIGTLELNGVNGQITGSKVLFEGGKISGSNLEINVPNVTMSGSSVDIRTSQFFLGSNSQFVSGSNNNIEISSSAFHLNPANNTMVLSGSITATDGNIGGFTIDSDEIKSLAGGSNTSLTVTAPGGSGEGYRIDNVVKPTLTFVVGNTYVFDISSGTLGSHPFRIGTSANGGTITDGVTITSSTLTIVVTSSTPTSLYYFCTAHSGMGNSISVINPPLVLNGANGQITASAAKISGDITITGGSLAGVTADTISGSVDEVSSSLAGRQTPFETQVVLSSGGMSLNKADGTSLAEYGTITRIGLAAQEHISASSAGITIKDGATQLGKFTAGGATLGATAGAHISASTTDVNVIYDANNKAVLDSNSLDITVGGNQVATFGANPIITGGTVTIRNQTNNNDKVVISENSFEVFDNNNAVASFGANTVIEGGTITLRNTTNNNDKVVISQDKFQVFDNNTDVASFGAVTRIGDVANEHISASSAGITIKDGSTVRGTFVAGGVTIGNTSQGHVSMSTADVSIKKDANNFAKIDSDSFDIILNGQTTASFGGTTTIGSTVGRHLKLTGTALEIKTDANTTALSASAAGLEMSGKVKATSGEIGGFGISATTVSSSNNNLILKSSGQITASAVSMSGTIVADSGNIGGFTIGSTTLTATDFTIDVTRKSITLGNGDDVFVADGDDGIQLGDATFADAPFSVTPAGFLKADSARIGGATGWQVGSNKLTSNAGNIALDANAGDIIVGSGANIVRLSGTSDATISAGSLTPTSAPFQVSKEGAMTASAAQISGKVTATSGAIGGFTLQNSRLTGSADAVLATSTSGRRVEIDGTDNSLKFYSGSGGAEVLSLSDNEGFYLITPSGGASYKASGITFQAGAGAFATPPNADTTSVPSANRYIGFGVQMPFANFSTGGVVQTENNREFIGFAVTHPGPTSISQASSENQFVLIGNLDNRASGSLFGTHIDLNLGPGGGTGHFIQFSDSTHTSAQSTADNRGVHIDMDKATLNANQYGIDIDMDGAFNNSNTSVQKEQRAINIAIDGNVVNASSYGAYIYQNADVSGGSKSVFGLYVNNQGTSAAANNYGVFVVGDTNYFSGDILVGGTVDGRDLATDGSKLDGIEASADVTDATNVQAAGALMDSELTNVSAVKGINQALTTTSTPTFADITISDLGTFAGGINVGATTDPGTDNMIVAGTSVFGKDTSTNDFTMQVYNGNNDGLVFIRDDSSSTDNEHMGAIAWDSLDGGTTTSTLQASAYILGTLAESHSSTNKGGDIRIGTKAKGIAHGANATERMRITSEGDIGIGTNGDPGTHHRLEVKKSVTGGEAAVVSIQNSSTNTSSGTPKEVLELKHGSTTVNDGLRHITMRQSNGTFIGLVKGDPVSYGTFTGFHMSQNSLTDAQITGSWIPGMIVKSNGNIIGSGSYLSEALPEVELTTTQKDKAVMGVYTNLDAPDTWRDMDNSKGAITYNALGEGRVLVTDTNGNIETGDYICSSNREGHGEKQDDDILHNYTVAKATQPIDFSTVSVDSDLGYKSILVACTYHCG